MNNKILKSNSDP